MKYSTGIELQAERSSFPQMAMAELGFEELAVLFQEEQA
jgi:hypothetical protein